MPIDIFQSDRLSGAWAQPVISGLTYITEEDQDTFNLTDAFVEFQWDWAGDDLDYELQYKKAGVSVWTKAHVRNPVGDFDEPSFSGTGTLLFTIIGNYMGETDLTFDIEIDGDGSPNTFKYSIDGGSSYIEGNAITGSTQDLAFGISIVFSDITGGVLLDHWSFPVRLNNPVRFRVKGFEPGDQIEWQIRTVQGAKVSQWIIGPKITAWLPPGPDLSLTQPSLSVVQQAILINWVWIDPTTGLPVDHPTNIAHWHIWKNTVDDFDTAQEIAMVSGRTLTHTDREMTTNVTFFYWLTCHDKFETISINHSIGSSLLFKFGMNQSTLELVPASLVQNEDGTFAYVDNEVVQIEACDVATGWVHDSTIPGAVLITESPIDPKEGTGSIRIALQKYPVIKQNTSTIAYQRFGYLTDNIHAIAEKIQAPSHAGNFAQVDLFCYLVGPPPIDPLVVSIYTDNAGDPDTLLRSAEVQGIDTTPSFKSGTFASNVPYTPDAFYHIVVETTQDAIGRYYWIGYRALASTGSWRMGDDLLSLGTVDPTRILTYRIHAESDIANTFIRKQLSAPVDISSSDFLQAWVKSSILGGPGVLQLGIGESAVSDLTFDVDITSTGTWLLSSSSLSSVATGDRDAILYVGIKVLTNATNIINIDDYRGGSGVLGLYWRKGGNLVRLIDTDDAPILQIIPGSKPLFGSGEDGDDTISVDTSLAIGVGGVKIAQYHNLTVNAGVKLTSHVSDNVLVLLVSGILTLNGRISMTARGGAGAARNTPNNTHGKKGFAGAAGAGGGGGAHASYVGGGGGGGFLDGADGATGVGGAGGNAGVSTWPINIGGYNPGQGGTGGLATLVGGAGISYLLSTFLSAPYIDYIKFLYGGGGASGGRVGTGGGYYGGAGGGGGGIMILAARNIVWGGAGVVDADGENGENAVGAVNNYGGGGGGGAGGVAIIITHSENQASVIHANGGTGGLPAGGSAQAGGVGSAGSVGDFHTIV